MTFLNRRTVNISFNCVSLKQSTNVPYTMQNMKNENMREYVVYF